MEPLEQWFVLAGYVRFHQWLGFQPYRLNSGNVSRFAIHTLVQWFVVAANLSLIIYRRRCILYHCESIGMVVDFIKLLTIGLAILVIYVELFRTIDNVCVCWRTLYKVHQTLQSQGMVDNRQLIRTMRFYWYFVLGTLLYFVGNEWFTYHFAQEMQTKRYYAYFFGLQYLLHIKLQQLIYPVIMLDLYLRMTRTALEHHVELLQCSERLGCSSYMEFLAGKVNTLKALHSDLFQVSVELNEAFGWTYLLIYYKNYIYILSNAYWVVFWILKNQLNHASRIISRLVIRTILLTATFYVNTCAMNTSVHFKHRLHTINLRIQIKSRSLYSMIVFTVGAYISIFVQQAVHQIDEMECTDHEIQCLS
uniref:Gustatory receptor n=1 Tax=Anopheles christyi TaxID=43041 RepID=A0A182JPJ2_9DIPT